MWLSNTRPRHVVSTSGCYYIIVAMFLYTEKTKGLSEQEMGQKQGYYKKINQG